MAAEISRFFSLQDESGLDISHTTPPREQTPSMQFFFKGGFTERGFCRVT